MKVPLSWLSEYVDLSGFTVQELSDLLTFSGVEVEGIDKVGHDYVNFVVGEVRACERHPQADKLSLCRVFDGTGELQVICGAPNVAAGQKVCLAKIGAKLPDGTAIRKARIRGVESYGMLCAADELGLSTDHAGILILDGAEPAGRPLAEVLPPPETVFDLEITWNRPDCLSIIGIAREFAALLHRPLRLPDVSFDEKGEAIEKLAAVKIEDKVNCPRYVARVMTDVRDGAAPVWLARRLELCGIRPISLIVDVTNYVMLECGQPLHAFDYNQVAEHTIVVRRAFAGEQMKTLDDIERKLDHDRLMIADPQRSLAVAGVMGGAGSEIQPGQTDKVLLESALFNPPSVKHTSTRLALRTESSIRFERGVDTDLADWASRRATSLLAKYGNATVARGAIDADYRVAKANELTLRFQRAREIIGVDLTVAQMITILTELGFAVVSQNAESATFRVPGWRLDMELEADLIEEIARINGLAAVPDIQPQNVVVPGAADDKVRAKDICRQTLLGFGFSEAMHYSFLASAEMDTFDRRHANWRVVLPNPVSADYAVMRDSLLPQLVATLGRNASRHTAEAPALFEMGRVFFRDGRANPCEEERMALGFCGPIGRPALDRRRPVTNEEAALWLKGVLEALATTLHAGAITLRLNEHPAFEPGWAAEILLDGTVIGQLGLLKSSLRHAWRLNTPLAVAEVQQAALLSKVFEHRPLQAIPQFPSVKRDVAFIAPQAVCHDDIVRAIRATGPDYLTKIKLFDIFQGKEIGNNQRSMAYELEFQSPGRTLTDEEVNNAFADIVAALQRELKVVIRAG